MPIPINNGAALGRTNRVFHHSDVRVRVHGRSDFGGVVGDFGERVEHGILQGIGPDGAGNGSTEGAADVIEGEVESCHAGDVFVLGGGLDAGEGRVGEEAASDTEEDLGADEAGYASAFVASESDQ